MPVVTTQEMRSFEKIAGEQYGLTEDLIIENVGHEVARDLFLNKLQNSAYSEIVFLIGRGNNGADGLSVARHLTTYGITCRAFILFPSSECSKDLKRTLKMAKAYGVKVSDVKTIDSLAAYFNETQQNFFVVDAIFGTGIRFPLAPYLCDIFHLVNNCAQEIVSLDIPSGINGDTGASDSSNFIKANETYAIGNPKMGHFLADGAKAKGLLKIVQAGFPTDLLQKGDKFLLSKNQVLGMIKHRNKHAHKNIFGRVLVIGGSLGLTGAPILSSLAALKIGTGLVTVATWKSNYQELAARSPVEVMLKMIPDEDFFLDEFFYSLKDRYDALVIGPGLGLESKTRELVLRVLQVFNGPIVLDADAINALNFKKDAHAIAKKGKDIVFTPHVGEFARFVGEEKKVILERPLEFIKNVVDELNCNVILKGPCSYLMPNSGEIFFNDYPNDGMAKGGTGDVLAGIVGGLLAQSFVQRNQPHYQEEKKIRDAMCIGVMLHTLAGMVAAEEYGVHSMTAKTLVESLSQVFLELQE